MRVIASFRSAPFVTMFEGLLSRILHPLKRGRKRQAIREEEATDMDMFSVVTD